MRMAISALLLSALLAPAIASAQPNDGGAPAADGGVSSGMDASMGSSRVAERSSTKSDSTKNHKAKPKSDDSGSEGSSGGAMPAGSSGSSKSAKDHSAVDGGPGRSS